MWMMHLWRVRMLKAYYAMNLEDTFTSKRSLLAHQLYTLAVESIKYNLRIEYGHGALSRHSMYNLPVKKVEEYVGNSKNLHLKIPSKAETPLTTSYRPELDVSPELMPRDSAYYQSLIGILWWIVELGRIDICLEVSMMSSHPAMPRKGHLDQVLHIFAYLRKYHNTELVYDPSDPVVEQDVFEQIDWTSSEFGAVQGKEEVPSNMPEPRGLGFIMHAKVDADHASDTMTRHSRTGFLVYLNCAPIYWWSKKQNSME